MLAQERASPLALKLNLDQGDRTIEMISRANGLFIITREKILRLRSPDSNDPDLEYSNAPWEQSEILPAGASDPIVARCLIQTKRLTEIFFAEQSETFQQLSDLSWEVMNSLVSLRFIRERLGKQIDAIENTIENHRKKYTEGHSPTPLPAIQYYDIEFRAFVNEVKRCLDKISELIPILSDLQFGKSHEAYKGKFSRGHFHKAEAWAKVEKGEDSWLAVLLKNDQTWIRPWIDMRIAIEHPSKEKFVETLNFTLEPSREIRLPTWRFVHPDYKDMVRPQNLLDIFEACIQNLLSFYEEFQIALADGHLPSNIKIQLETIPEEQRNIELPLRFRMTPYVSEEEATN